MEIIILLIIGAIICEFIDSYLGMMYGTILTPVLLIAGFNPLIIVPSILISQACGGFIASFRHHRFKNARFEVGSKDFKIASIIVGLGILAVIFGVFVGINIPKLWLQTYIGVLCVVMGSIALRNRIFKFSWKRIAGIGIISSFNKALSGGGFGPIVASGQVISGREGKEAIGTTDFAEAPICLIAFIFWVLLNGMPNLTFILPLTGGAIIGGFFGPLALSKFKSRTKLKLIIGILVVGLGIWTIAKTWL